jgi:ABC-type uncharacterized transport system substrate-binding protein
MRLATGVRTGLVCVVALLLVILACVPAETHPHVFVEHSLLIRLSPAGLEGVSVHWTFDEFFSAVLVQSFDRDRNGRLSPEELRSLERDQTEKLSAVAFFVEVRVDGIEVAVRDVRDFRVTVTDERVSYDFFVPLRSPNSARATVEVNVEDPTIYSWFKLVRRGSSAFESPPSYIVECTATRFQQSRNPDANAIRCAFQTR